MRVQRSDSWFGCFASIFDSASSSSSPSSANPSSEELVMLPPGFDSVQQLAGPDRILVPLTPLAASSPPDHSHLRAGSGVTATTDSLHQPLLSESSSGTGSPSAWFDIKTGFTLSGMLPLQVCFQLRNIFLHRLLLFFISSSEAQLDQLLLMSLVAGRTLGASTKHRCSSSLTSASSSLSSSSQSTPIEQQPDGLVQMELTLRPKRHSAARAAKLLPSSVDSIECQWPPGIDCCRVLLRRHQQLLFILPLQCLSHFDSICVSNTFADTFCCGFVADEGPESLARFSIPSLQAMRCSEWAAFCSFFLFLHHAKVLRRHEANAANAANAASAAAVLSKPSVF
jgi:hypothetical protein